MSYSPHIHKENVCIIYIYTHTHTYICTHTHFFPFEKQEILPFATTCMNLLSKISQIHKNILIEKSKTVLFVEVETRTVVTRGYGMWGIREMLVKRYIISFMQGEEFLKISCTA